ncbi:MAG TPA: PIN domain-containing protein [Thermoanaerobaculia bacterium]|nr:PIN domain-containing protein [Thermoanaerobaculia bacterium]
MAFLFDTDAISEVLKKQPARGYLRWLAELPRAERFTSAIAIGELFRGAFRATTGLPCRVITTPSPDSAARTQSAKWAFTSAMEALLVPAAEMEQLARLKAAGPEKGLAGLAGGWEGSEEMIEWTTIQSVGASKPGRGS